MIRRYHSGGVIHPKNANNDNSRRYFGIELEIDRNSSFSSDTRDRMATKLHNILNENGEYKFHFDYNENAPSLPFSWVVTPTKDIASKIMPAPRFLAGRWGNQSSGGEVTTSMQNTSNNSLTYTQSGSLLTLHTQGQPCKVYAVDGTLLLSTDAAQDEVTIELNKGLYIVYSNGTSHKILF